MSILQSLGALDILLGLCGAILVYRYARTMAQLTLPLPPGPKPLPLIGNLLDMPTGNVLEGKHWANHKALYGPISSVRTLGTTIIVINDSSIAFELLEKRSSKYSSRPFLTFAGELVGFNVDTSILPYGDILRQHRKWSQSFFGSQSAMKRIEDVQEVETRRLVLRLLENPIDIKGHLHAFAGAIILKITYGYNIDPKDRDYLVALADKVNHIFSVSLQPGRWLVDTIPALKYMPEWFPGAGFKKTARNWIKIVQESNNKPFEFVKYQMARGYAQPSFVEHFLDKGILDKDEEILKHAATTMYGAGAETTATIMETFYLAMTLYPAVFRRAQEEIDRIIGDDRLPSFADCGSLPYINAICKEVLRWEVVLPLAIPHATTEEDVYNGYRIPKGAIVIPNIWQITHDPDIYEDPFSFNPERFLGENGNPVELDPSLLVFGFGRRICPGMEVAQKSLFLAIAMSTAVFNITKAKDASGKEIEPIHEYLPGLISLPRSFQCSITPRSDKTATLIRTVLDEQPFEKGDGDTLKAL